MILPAPMLDTYTRLPNARIFSGIPGKLTPNVNTAKGLGPKQKEPRR
jgi:hypothetical protein